MHSMPNLPAPCQRPVATRCGNSQGKRYVSTPVAPTSNGDRIPGKEGVRFGYSYVLSGKRGTAEMVKHVYRFPPGGMPDKVAGGTRSTYEHVEQHKIGEHVLIGWSFKDSPPERIVLGDWSIEVWQGGRKLAEKRFTVYQP